MNTEAVLIFPHQLFAGHPSLQQHIPVYVVEEWLFFHEFRFHKQKLMLHRASMQTYADALRMAGYMVEYIESFQEISDIRLLLPHLAAAGIQKIRFAEVADNWLMRRLQSGCRQLGIDDTISPSPGFLCQPDTWKPFFDQQKNYFQTAFYIEQRKQRSLLLDAKGKPLGGHWTYDTENRKKYPPGQPPPPIWFPESNPCTDEARRYVEQHFPDNPGNTEQFSYPVTPADAEAWLDDFLQHRFHGFGPYEDALVSSAHFLHHSVLTPLLNTGLLTPDRIVSKALDAAARLEVPLASLEGFIRQITGWREFIRIVYEREGSRQRSKNFWGFKRRIPPAFYTGNTGIFPVDNAIRKLLRTGYNHHIERLMVLGNFMLLCEFDPDEVYRWFMEMYIDAFDWVMVPNVYGMSQFADGGLMTTKPYISGSNYLMKMSDYPKGPWTAVWDALFWRFMHVHRDFFTRNPRLGMLVKTFDKMAPGRKQELLARAEAFLEQLDQSLTEKNTRI